MDKKLLNKLIKLLAPYLPFAILSLLASIVTVVMQLYAPILSGRAIDCIIGKGDVLFERLTGLIVRFIFVIAASVFFQWIMNIMVRLKFVGD